MLTGYDCHGLLLLLLFVANGWTTVGYTLYVLDYDGQRQTVLLSRCDGVFSVPR
ncbi:hypothetical protein BT67DRAFT_441111 [Trichocladium antarcticum]|uniref:Uncharacterized protein n=1 Tax=Trichocladium antarcticum TaxID=1450529 RepID=A0AAN6UML6_9PEZI|nr:hypothetical protein BT67DRAFT_441111 [Trichocladium antarcticum]